MTLVYVRQTENLVYFLADTFSEEASTGKQFNWFSEPILKIFRRYNFVIAFAGNSYNAQRCISSIACDDFSTAVTTLRESSSSGGVEYAILDVPTNQLVFIQNETVQKRATGYLGEQSGRELFQKHRTQKAIETQDQMHITQLVDTADSGANEDYSRSLRAFKAALVDSGGSFGGVAISYTICNAIGKYGTYTSLYRGPLSEAETPLSGWGTVPHQDSNFGAYRVEVWGSRESLAIYFPDAALGHIFTTADAINIEPNTLRRIDGYDFNDAAVASGCGVGGASTWRNWQSAYQKAMQNIQIKDYDRAAKRLTDVEETITSALSGRNPNKAITLDLDFVSTLQSHGRINLTVDLTNAITSLLELRRRYFEALGDTTKRDLCQRQVATWTAWIDAVTIEMRFN